MQRDRSSSYSQSWVDLLMTPAEYVAKKVKPGGVTGSIFNVVMIVVGGGVLSLPYAVKQVGIVPGLITLFLGCNCAIFTVSLLCEASADVAERKLSQFDNHILNESKTKQVVSYTGLAKVLWGKKGEWLVAISLVLTLWGVVISYIFGTIQLVQEMVKDFQHTDTLPGFWKRTRILECIFTCGVIFPISLFRDLSSLRYTSMFGLFCAAYLALIICIEYIVKCANGDLQWFDLSATEIATHSLGGYLHVVPLTGFSFGCHTSILNVYEELERKSHERMMMVTNRALYTCFTLYVLAGGFGFLTFLGDTEDNIFLNYGGNVFPVLIGEVALTAVLALSCPIYIVVLRGFIKCNELSLLSHVGITTFILGSALGVAMAVKNISSVFEIVGATTLPLNIFILPSIFYFKLVKNPVMWKKILCVFLSTLISVLSIFSLLEKADLVHIPS